GGYNRYRYGAKLIRRTQRVPRLMRRGAAHILTRMADHESVTRYLERHRPSDVAGQHPLSERLRKVARVLAAGDAREAYESLMNVGTADPPIRHGTSHAAA